MSMHYTDPTRESNPYALPDVEVFYIDSFEDDDAIRGEDGEFLPEGWYYWACSPGCLPDSEPLGPFDTEAEALEDAQSWCE